MPLKLLVVDDHPVVHAGLSKLCEQRDFRISPCLQPEFELYGLLNKFKPDLVLLDVRLGEVDGFAVLESIRKEYPDQAVVMFSAFDNPTYVARAIALGAQNYLLKTLPPDELIECIERAAAGMEPETDSLFQRVRMTMQRRQIDESDHALTRRELQVLRHLALGLSNREIGKSLDISVETVKEHVQNVLRKINVHDRTQAAIWAVRQGLA